MIFFIIYSHYKSPKKYIHKIYSEDEFLSNYSNTFYGYKADEYLFNDSKELIDYKIRFVIVGIHSISIVYKYKNNHIYVKTYGVSINEKEYYKNKTKKLINYNEKELSDLKVIALMNKI